MSTSLYSRNNKVDSFIAYRIAVGNEGPQWYQYFLCGIRGIYEALPEDFRKPKGMRVVVSGTIPQSAGLSSSSALVSAAALATSYAHQVSYSNPIKEVQYSLFRSNKPNIETSKLFLALNERAVLRFQYSG